jgi:acyl-CoA synthetase (AMP-forming)/AMP-acid ligase II
MTGLVAPGTRLIDADSGRVLAGADLTAAVDAVRRRYDTLPDGVLFARTALRLDATLHYVAAFESGRAVALLDPALPAATLTDLVTRYRPAAVTGVDEGAPPSGYTIGDDEGLGPHWRREGDSDAPAPHPDLAVLLATSGSTGSPKFVRQARSAVLANAEAIATGLGIDGGEIAPTCLPLFYTYGLSVLNSHLVAGASIVIADGGVLSREFWRAVDTHAATSLAGVPYHYEMLTRIRWTPAAHPSLRTLTQAGGKMRVELVERMFNEISAVGGRLFVMYGQTEATARITILPADRLPEKLGSAGVAIPGGTLSVSTEDGGETTEPKVTGEVIFRGPNVMMGYAESAADLAGGDELGGRLATGDLGYLDEDGFLYLTGRAKRIGKIFGVRVSLDDIERLVGDAGPAAAVPAGDRVVVWCTAADEETCRAVTDLLSKQLKLHRSGFVVRSIDRLPTLTSGKVDYRTLIAEAEKL